ncbi:hypothetical protein LX36DRAFT_342188 [Colletotrichum falcatum]|nr:hypothetical protein LX36DRAFT_342188 [Colletotrichum falcatum]
MRLYLRGFYVDIIAPAAATPSGGVAEDADELVGYTAELLATLWRRYMAADALELLARQEGSNRHTAMSRLLHLDREIEGAVNGTMIPEEKEGLGVYGLSLRDSWRNYWFLCGKRDLFVTGSRGFGFAPSGMKPGDEIWVLCDGKMPLLFRPVEGGGAGGDAEPVSLPGRSGFYRLVGECYMHGIMDGEAAKEGRTRLRTIAVC